MDENSGGRASSCEEDKFVIEFTYSTVTDCYQARLPNGARFWFKRPGNASVGSAVRESVYRLWNALDLWRLGSIQATADRGALTERQDAERLAAMAAGLEATMLMDATANLPKRVREQARLADVRKAQDMSLEELGL